MLVVLCMLPFIACALLGLNKLKHDFVMRIFIFGDLFLYFFVFVIIYILNIVHSKDNIACVLALQDIQIFFNNRITFKVFTKGNWIRFFLIAGFHFFFCIFDYFIGIPWPILICGLVLFGFDAIMVYAIRIISWLEAYVVLWNEEVLKSQNSDGNKVNLLEMYHAYNKILECYWVFKKYYQHLVSITIIAFVFRMCFEEIGKNEGFYMKGILTKNV